MKKTPIFFLFLIVSATYGQEFYTISHDKITLDNGKISKVLIAAHDSLFSSHLHIPNSSWNYINKSKEFSFTINDQELNGYSGWTLVNKVPIHDDAEGYGLRLVLESSFKPKVELAISYLLYPDLPLIRKWFSISNNDTQDLKLENVNVEDLETRLSQVHSVVHHNYGRMKHLGKYVGNWDDPVVVVHNLREHRGIALGNEAPGVLKRTAYHTKNNNIEVGLTHHEEDFPYRKWITPGEIWESTKIFICLYENRDDGFQVIEQEVNEFTINHMKPKIVQLEEKPTFVYNTWNPFRTFINDSLIHEVADAAADCGIQEFILDDGWQINVGGKTSDVGWGKNYGDWQVDTIKFPGGLRPTFDYIKSKGMIPGLWISIGAATQDAKVFQDHPEWFVKNQQNELGDIHQDRGNTGFYSSCYGTDWQDYISQTILRMVNEHGLGYAKLDFAVVASAYVNNKAVSGCYASDHPYHRDHYESFGIIYQNVLKLFDELHEKAPELFIDCTFETAGKLQLMDYAIAQHAEGNWLSNFEEPSPTGPLRVRQMAWWRSPALPASSLVIGNQVMDDPGFEFSLKSLIGTLPIVLGDPRKLTVNQKETIRKWSVWMQEMQKKYDYMTYRKDLQGFGEPKEGAWDGWQRINFQTKKGGIFGVFRQGALEENRTVFLKDLEPDKNYVIREAPNGEMITKNSGKHLMSKGMLIKIEKAYDGRIFEIGME